MPRNFSWISQFFVKIQFFFLRCSQMLNWLQKLCRYFNTQLFKKITKKNSPKKITNYQKKILGILTFFVNNTASCSNKAAAFPGTEICEFKNLCIFRHILIAVTHFHEFFAIIIIIICVNFSGSIRSEARSPTDGRLLYEASRSAVCVSAAHYRGEQSL